MIVEVAIDQNGSITEARFMFGESLFAESAVEAARGWSFRTGLYRNRRVGTRAYLIVGFRGIQI